MELQYCDLDELIGCCGCEVLNGLSLEEKTLKKEIPTAIEIATDNNRAFILATTNEHQEAANKLLPFYGFIKARTMNRPKPDNWIHLWYLPLAGVQD